MNSMPAVKEIELPEAASMGVAVEGSTAAWPAATEEAMLPGFDVFNQPKRYIDMFNKGKAPFAFTATASAPWVTLSAAKGTVEKEQRLWVSIDWSKAPKGVGNASRDDYRRGRARDREVARRQSRRAEEFAQGLRAGRRLRLHRGGALRAQGGRQRRALGQDRRLRPHRIRHDRIPGDRRQHDFHAGRPASGVRHVLVRTRQGGGRNHPLADA